MTPFAHAGIINIQSDSANSTEGLGTFTGTLDYDAGTSTLIVSLTNTTTAAVGGFITGFVFNIDSADPAASATLLSGTHPFQNTGTEAANPFGTFEAGAALDGNWSGGGNPSSGIAVGETGTFTFDVTASNAGSLTVQDFITDQGPDQFDFVVRFRGMSQGGSDKVPGVIPGPSALAALALGLALSGRRRRNS